MEADEIGDTIEAIREEVFDRMISQFIPPESHDEVWDAAGLERALEGEFGIEVPVVRWLEEDDSLAEPGLREKIMDVVKDRESTRLNSSHVAISYAVFCLKN